MDQADPLWESFQDKISDFVNENGGNSTLPKIRNHGTRPDWNKVKNFLNGKITLEEFSWKFFDLKYFLYKNWSKG
ncbi:MAG: hypothetical protein ACOCWM_00810 [Cyclobacteriaceae bacterium]